MAEHQPKPEQELEWKKTVAPVYVGVRSSTEGPRPLQRRPDPDPEPPPQPQP